MWPPHSGSRTRTLTNDTRLETLRRMAEDRPDDARLRFGLAVELLNRGETREGAGALKAYLDIAQDEGNGWGRLGAALADLGETEEAREAYRRGIEIANGRGHGGLVEELEEAMEDLS
jgi:Flp pilus assembly protein TadD